MNIQPDLSVCVVAGNQAGPLRDFLGSLAATADPVAAQTIVIDNGSKDETAAMVAKEFPEAILYENGLREPTGRARNRVFRFARGRYLSFWDPDLILAPGCLARLVDFLDDNPTTAIAGPGITDPAGVIEPTGRPFPTLFSILRAETAPESLLPAGRSHRPASRDLRLPFEVDWLSGPLVIRQEALEELGRFDETLAHPYGNALYCLRARRLGWHVHHLPAAEAVRSRPRAHSGGLAQGLRFLGRKWFTRGK